MRQLFQIFEKDIMSENFSRSEIIAYGVVMPLVLVAAALIAGVIE